MYHYQIMGQICEQTHHQPSSPITNQTHQSSYNRTHQTKTLATTSGIIYPCPQSTLQQGLNYSQIHLKLTNIDHLQQSHLGYSAKNAIQHVSASRLSKIKREELKKFYVSELGGYYYGETTNNLPNGYGSVQFDNGDYLEGHFSNGFCNGKGVYIKKSGSSYEGDLRNNIADGYGKYVDEVSGYRYEGQWKNNLPNGRGEAQYHDQVKYNGQFLNNKKHGKGILMQKGCILQGNFISDQLNGKAMMKLDNGECYIGMWKDNRKQGLGEYSWPNGNTYKGNYTNDKKSGFGIMSYFNGDYYKGQWRDGVKHGLGQYKSSIGATKGRWSDGNLFEEHQKEYQMSSQQ